MNHNLWPHLTSCNFIHLLCHLYKYYLPLDLTSKRAAQNALFCLFCFSIPCHAAENMLIAKLLAAEWITVLLLNH